LIEQVKIGAMTYRVKELSDLHKIDGEGRKRGLNGQILYSDSVINIEADMSIMIKRVTLLHEIMHGILDHAGHEEHPETAIIALGYGLLEVLRDNPALVDLLRESP